MKKVVLISITVLTILVLTACGQDKVIGKWKQMNKGSRVILIEKDGSYRYYRYGLNGNYYLGSWKKQGKSGYVFTGSISGSASTGDIDKDGHLVVNVDGGGEDTIGAYTFEK